MVTDAYKPKPIDACDARVSCRPLSAASPAVVNAGPGRVRSATATLLIAALMLATVAPALADKADDKALMARVQRLEAQVRALEAKVTALEQSQKAVAPAVATPAPATTASEVAAQAAAQLRREDAAVLEGWRRIARGLSQEEVKRLLGAPQQTFDLSGKRVWYYYYPAGGSGSVLFDPAGHVVGYQAPPSSGFRLY
jgi:hypothetical protein